MFEQEDQRSELKNQFPASQRKPNLRRKSKLKIAQVIKAVKKFQISSGKMKTGEKDVEIIRGDGLLLSIDTNNKLLEIKGDGCKITLWKNFGTIRVNGDGCHLKVVQNLGSIEYTGDGGRVDLGPDSNNTVTFSGCGGHLKFLDATTTQSRGKRGNVIIDSQAKKDLRGNLNENQKQKFCEFESENRENERRERRERRGKVDEKCERGASVIGTKIVGSNGECKTNVRIFYENADPTRS